MHIIQEISNWPHCCDKMGFLYLRPFYSVFALSGNWNACLLQRQLTQSVIISKVTCYVPSFGSGRASGWRHQTLPDGMLSLCTLQSAVLCVRGECVNNMKTSHLQNVLHYNIDMCATPSAPSTTLKLYPQILYIYMNSSRRSFWNSWCSFYLLSISTGWRVP